MRDVIKHRGKVGVSDKPTNLGKLFRTRNGLTVLVISEADGKAEVAWVQGEEHAQWPSGWLERATPITWADLPDNDPVRRIAAVLSEGQIYDESGASSGAGIL